MEDERTWLRRLRREGGPLVGYVHTSLIALRLARKMFQTKNGRQADVTGNVHDFVEVRTIVHCLLQSYKQTAETN